jgi:glycerol-3-phosphate acyltransferase PlsY
MFEIALVFIAAYFLGSVPTAYIIAKMIMNIDIREKGSGNVGATNALRVMGKRYGALVLACDFLKAFAAASIGEYFFGQTIGLIAALIAIAGHIFPLWLKFKGGKGVAAGLGGLTAVFPLPMLFVLVVWLVVVLLSGYVSLGSVCAAIFFEIYLLALPFDTLHIILLTPMVILIIYEHRVNIRRIIRGEEHSFRKKSALLSKNKRNDEEKS